MRRADGNLGWSATLLVTCTSGNPPSSSACVTTGLPSVMPPTTHGKSIRNGNVHYLDVGPSSANKKCVPADADVQCPATWTLHDQFAITREGGEICARRVDGNDNWGAHLVVTCTSGNMPWTTSTSSSTTKLTTMTTSTSTSAASTYYARIGPSDSNKKCVVADGDVKCPALWVLYGEFAITREGIQICARRVDGSGSWIHYLVVTCTSDVRPTTSESSADRAVLAVSEAVDKGVAQVLADPSVSRISFSTQEGTLTAVELPSATAGRASIPMGDGVVVSLPQALQQSLPAGAVLVTLNMDNESSPLDNAFQDLGALSSRPLEISLRGSSGEKLETTKLAAPLLFKLPGSERRLAQDADALCVFLDATGAGPARWSTRGVWRASTEEVEAAGEVALGVWCFSEHLSIFASLLLGCTNLEMLTEEGFRAVSENEAWRTAEGTAIVFFVWALFSAVALLGIVRECWELRFGRTPGTPNRIFICKKFLTWGPQLLKHKYTAFITFAKEIINCATTRRVKLKNATLTASVQRFLAVRTGVCVACVSQHCFNGAAWIDAKASLPKTVLCRKLEFHAGMADMVIENDIFAPGVLGFVRRFLMTWLAVHPLLDSLRMGAGSNNVKKRTALQVASVCGVLATNALIFNFVGNLRSWEADYECPISPTSQFFVIVATMVSMAVCALPNAFLLDLAKQVYGRLGWTAAWWALVALYLCMTVPLTVLVLANLSPKEQKKWYFATEWVMAIKLLGTPTAQAIRNTFLLEVFLKDDRKAKPKDTFRVFMGLSHKYEADLTDDQLEAARKISQRSISAEELLNFTALLGEKIMMDFHKDSTTEEVVHRAVEPLSRRPPNLSEHAVHISVVEAHDLCQDTETLVCTVLHLGTPSSHERLCVGEERSQEAALKDRRVQWHFQTDFSAMLPDHALGFVVSDAQGERSSVASLKMEDVWREGAWSGDLLLHPTDKSAEDNNAAECMAMSGEVAQIPHTRDVAGSRGVSKVFLAGKITVIVKLPRGYQQLVLLHELRNERNIPRQTDLDDVMFQVKMTKDTEAMTAITTAASAYCKPRGNKDGILPPERMVVHSRQGRFTHLVSSVIADAIGSKDIEKTVQEMILCRDFDGVQELMEKANCSATRYWLDMFAVRNRTPQQEDTANNWHEGFLSLWPSILRSMRRESCDKMVSDIKLQQDVRSPGPLIQLLVLDSNFRFMHDAGCLAELMLANSLRVRQRLVLHPDHLHGKSLGVELKRLSKSLAMAYDTRNPSYVNAYLEDKQAVYDIMLDLITRSVKEHKPDTKETWEELDMTDVHVTIAASVLAANGATVTGATGAGKVDLDDVEAGGGMDFDA